MLGATCCDRLSPYFAVLLCLSWRAVMPFWDPYNSDLFPLLPFYFAVRIILSSMTRYKRKGSPSETEKDTSSSDHAAAEDKELVTLTTLKHMLSIQESLMRSILDSFVSSATSRVDDVVKTVASLKASLEFTQKDVEGMKTIATDLKVAEEEVGKLRTALETQTSQMEYFENKSRRNNIRASGIPESPGETWDSAESKVKQAIEEELGIAVDIERAHRVNRRHPRRNGGRGDPEKPRTIKAYLSERIWLRLLLRSERHNLTSSERQREQARRLISSWIV